MTDAYVFTHLFNSFKGVLWYACVELDIRGNEYFICKRMGKTGILSAPIYKAYISGQGKKTVYIVRDARNRNIDKFAPQDRNYAKEYASIAKIGII